MLELNPVPILGILDRDEKEVVVVTGVEEKETATEEVPICCRASKA